MSYGKYVKAEDDVLRVLLEEFDIPTELIIYRGREDKADVAKIFVEEIGSGNIKKSGKIIEPILVTPAEIDRHIACVNFNLCNGGFSTANLKVEDHNHLSGRFRLTLCNKCNLKC